MELCLGKSPNLKNSVNRFFFSLNYRPRRLPPIGSLVLIKAKPNAAVLWWWSGGGRWARAPAAWLRAAMQQGSRERSVSGLYMSLVILIDQQRLENKPVLHQRARCCEAAADVWGLCSHISGIRFYIVARAHDTHSSAVWTAAGSLRVIWTAPLSTTIASKYWGNKNNTILMQTDDNGDNLLHERLRLLKKKRVTAERISLAWLIMLGNVWMSVRCLKSDLTVKTGLRWRLRWSAPPGLLKWAPAVTLAESKIKL